VQVVPDSAVYAFTSDFVDAGIEAVADELSASGFSATALATVYHEARDLLPHNPRRAVAHRREGAYYFVPAASLYRGALCPPEQPDETAGDFDAITDALSRRGLGWQAWTVYLHNCRLAMTNPEYAVTNAFGDRYITDLCPSSDAVTSYAAELTADIARLAPSLIVAESLHHAGFGHGYHHERAFVDVSAVTSFLLSLCFCEPCMRAAQALDVDAKALREQVRRVVRTLLDAAGSGPDILSRDELAALCGAPILAYLRARERGVAALASRCADVAHAAGVPFGFIDQTGALKGYVTGDPHGRAAVDDAWQLGIPPGEVAAAVDSYVVLAYAKQEARVAFEIESYSAALHGAARLRCVLRHGGVDYVDAANLTEKVAGALRSGASGVDFYHYGLMPRRGLSAAAMALRAVAARRQ
jgi:hypothetical protein